MADRKITELTAMSAGTQATGDLLTIVDVSEAAAVDKNKKITVESLFQGIPSSVKIGGGSTVTADSNADDLVIDKGAADTGLSILSTTTGRIYFGDAADDEAGSIRYVHSDNSMRFETASSERLRIDSSGRLLIGTSTSPSGGDASSQNASLLIQGRIGNAADSGRINLQRGSAASNGSNIGSISFTDNSNNAYARIDADADATTGSNDYPGRLVFSTCSDGASSPTERLKIDSSGNLNFAQEASSSYPEQKLKWSNDSTTANGFYISQDSSRNGKIFHEQGLDILFGTNNSERLRIDSSGNVGIGASSPAAKLDIAGNQLFSAANPQIQFNAGGPIIRLPSANTLAFLSDSSTERMRLDSSGNVHIGNSTNSAHTNRLLSVGKTDRAASFIEIRTSTSGDGGLLFSDGTGSGNEGYRGTVEYNHSSDYMFFRAAGTERMRLDTSGNLLIGTTTNGSTAAGTVIRSTGETLMTRSSGPPLLINRTSSDGGLIDFRQDNTSEGSINVSGSSVTLVGAHLSRWSQLPGGVERIEILRGSVLSNLDEMCEWGEEDNEQLNRMKVSDVEGDKNVSGVFQSWDDDDDTYTNDFYCAMTGDFVIRIAQGTTVARGDLLMSAGDGTAKPQDDDIVRSKTIAKVTSTTVSTTYSDNSYCVPCVLMAC